MVVEGPVAVPANAKESPTQMDPGAPALGVGSTGYIEKAVVLVPVAWALETVIVPEVAVAGNVAVIVVLLTIVKAAVTPLNLTDVAPVKLVPVIVTNG